MWRIIYIEKSDYLSLYLDNLKVRNGLDETTIPLSDINSIVIDNYATTITTSLITKCMEYKVNIICCDTYHLPAGIIIPYSGNYQSSSQLFKQVKWEDEILKFVWQQITKAKITNQARTLMLTDKHQEVINHLLKFIDEVELGDKTNREGLSAKMYFRELFGDHFTRHEDDTINASLNYGYSILRSMIARALVARGLNPHLGIFHRGPGNDFNLADDFIEVFRPIIDLWVHDNINLNDIFDREKRLSLINLMTKKISYNDKKVTIINAINILIDNFLSFIETGEVDKLIFPDVKTYDSI